MNINEIPTELLGQGSKIRLERCGTEHDLYWKAALEVIEVINDNNQKGEDTLMIVPYGPLGPYSRLVYLINKYRISLRRCCFINMDEYLTEDLNYIDYNDPLSFRGGMDRIFYNLIDDELNLLPENRIFPIPGEENAVLETIERYQKLDMVWGGVGINGHFAFNEPPEPGEEVSNEEFINRKTRVLKISRETRTINAFMNCSGDIDGIPANCITVGMKEIFMADRIRMCMPRGWNAGALRKILHGPATAAVPCSLFQNHKDAVLFAADDALASTVPEIRIYNK